ncbi:NAD dehydrogenase [Artomyces pyxidatus]|uniref:NAD dehydrogenase n=1 Tax=Artomyces pyxidatus TaxID=48021 RepID=A0ACB8TLB5_9AGAM|nr:NAD dehydrogenase [Artomyces pyxidatus]
MKLYGVRAALNSNGKFGYKPPESVVDYLVVGGGVVGLAIARHLSLRFVDKTTVLLERHKKAGQEISSRNSEIIHAGLYYPPESLKTRFCLRGRQLLYNYCKQNNVPFRKTGKLVVARGPDDEQYIANLHSKAQNLLPPPRWDPDDPVLPTELIDGDQARDLEPDLSKKIVKALWSPTTGIVDSHQLMESMEKDIMGSDSGELAYSTAVVRVDPHAPDSALAEDGWVVQSVTGGGTDGDAVLARVLINASGLAGPLVLNSLLPEAQRIPMYFARGSYAAYGGRGVRWVSRLIYPCPPAATSGDAHAFHSLGTHLTLDMQGKVRFGPNLEWIYPAYQDRFDPDVWARHLVPDDTGLNEMQRAVRRYLPRVQRKGMHPDYVGIRPKLVPPGAGFQDFVLRTDYSGDFLGAGHARGRPMITLLGIESPGLTSSLALAEAVVEDMLVAHNDHVQ